MPTPNIPAIGTISDPTKVRVALMQGNEAVNGPPLSVVAAAVGVPSGGTTGQVLTKSTDADYDSGWADIPAQGDLSGPASAVDGNFAAFDGTTGKLVKDSGKKASDFQTALGYTPANVAGDTFTGNVTAPRYFANGTNGSIELGALGVANTPFIDFHSGAANIDYDSRIIASGGGTVGTGGLTFLAGGLFWTGTPSATTSLVNKAYADALPLAKSYESAQQTITAGGSLTLAHGLGAAPKLYQAYLKCVTADLGYSAGDETLMNPHTSNNSATSNRGLAMVPDATNINVRFGSDVSVISIIRKDTGGTGNPTLANWRLIVRAWL